MPNKVHQLKVVSQIWLPPLPCSAENVWISSLIQQASDLILNTQVLSNNSCPEVLWGIALDNGLQCLPVCTICMLGSQLHQHDVCRMLARQLLKRIVNLCSTQQTLCTRICSSCRTHFITKHMSKTLSNILSMAHIVQPRCSHCIYTAQHGNAANSHARSR